MLRSNKGIMPQHRHISHLLHLNPRGHGASTTSTTILCCTSPGLCLHRRDSQRCFAKPGILRLSTAASQRALPVRLIQHQAFWPMGLGPAQPLPSTCGLTRGELLGSVPPRKPAGAVMSASPAAEAQLPAPNMYSASDNSQWPLGPVVLERGTGGQLTHLQFFS
ncbi:hypothetical protein BHE90_017568 [Fusarium euwallaceae]|uniref:Uncharacterized protein n=3 Tax=Fusarium solani species complex TaxID=232080 RepID=A0A3M2QS61_9HYPO|nr:hypothetical protein CDV36_016374 [Fusarium kuroshium]RSL47083.1 hypothetical protein CEP51_015825 [Fusarium floridanum]RTE68055.1 hypothetical protein BHE90_017568 [Fusarium euwallaceae]